MANRKLEKHIEEIGWPSFLNEIADIAKQDAGRYGPRNQELMRLSSRLNNLSDDIRGHVPSFPGNYFKEKVEEEDEMGPADIRAEESRKEWEDSLDE